METDAEKIYNKSFVENYSESIKDASKGALIGTIVGFVYGFVLGKNKFTTSIVGSFVGGASLFFYNNIKDN
jgi:ABC-type nitrate/sulfonate/bicarbonate transport system permease component